MNAGDESPTVLGKELIHDAVAGDDELPKGAASDQGMSGIKRYDDGGSILQSNCPVLQCQAGDLSEIATVARHETALVGECDGGNP